ncbi:MULTISPECIES: hypothetical protein [Paenibacillus]|uniref:Uncharacterized protein n=1 Tax=Paenibacillus naphthalenovorans TaxID=162209 RepID=A0A0U2VXG7_9BACL|nr:MULTISPECIES: hypothetical protein [Paenibacillus]ALS20996.1 hypothetical protein IJ22_06110 [Paenibacillus naphthalenovorans]NTZ18776.1 hypothetical protein [Paenibacillus sp. JMULE4]GCL71030.1 hypothetical protein PN4B1_09340 [Paenibacillus naphthalenovorans]SDI61061.1 hypothetical protein SAMN05421868_108106 [Paenibacillus naphthalenovorans]
MSYSFIMDERIGIPLPHLEKNFEDYSEQEQAEILLRWEEIRGMIPDRIKRLETMIIARQDQLNVEDNFAVSCRLNTEIADLASTINELHLWFRVHQDMAVGAAHH